MKKRVELDARVSTDKQTTDNQLRQLREIADRNGWNVVEEFVDEGISGSKGRDKRQRFDAMIKGAVRRRFDLVMSWSVDRLGRSLQLLVEFLSELHAVGCDLYLHQQAIDTTTPSGKMMFQMCGVFAEFERSIIQQRKRQLAATAWGGLVLIFQGKSSATRLMGWSAMRPSTSRR